MPDGDDGAGRPSAARPRRRAVRGSARWRSARARRVPLRRSACRNPFPPPCCEQHAAVAAWDRVAVRGEVNGPHRAGRCAEQDHLALHRMDVGADAERGEQVAAPGAGADDEGVRGEGAVRGLDGGDVVALVLPAVTGCAASTETPRASTSARSAFTRRGCGRGRRRGARVRWLPAATGRARAHGSHRARRLRARRDGRSPGGGDLLLAGASTSRPKARAPGRCRGVAQLVAQRWVVALAPARQLGDSIGVTPGVEGRHDAAAGPGRLAPRLAALHQGDVGAGASKLARREQANHAAADDQYVGHAARV